MDYLLAVLVIILAIIGLLIIIKIRNVIAKRKAEKTKITNLETNRFLRHHPTCPDGHKWDVNRINAMFYKGKFYEIRAWCLCGQCFYENPKHELILLPDLIWPTRYD